MAKYKVICSSCNGWSEVDLNTATQQLKWTDIGTVISARLRFDNQWGWQCLCGKNTLMTKQEKRQIKNYVNPTPQEITEIKDNLELRIDNTFAMEAL